MGQDQTEEEGLKASEVRYFHYSLLFEKRKINQ